MNRAITVLFLAFAAVGALFAQSDGADASSFAYTASPADASGFASAVSSEDLPLNPPPYEVKADVEVRMGKTPSGFDYALYSDDEFAPWQKKLRRAEIIFFGGIPLAFLAAGLVNSLTGSTLGFWPVLGISASVAVSISLVDFIIGEIDKAR